MRGRLLSLSEACGRAGVAVKTARSWLYRAPIQDPDLHDSGKGFTAITGKVGSRLKIDEADLNSWLASRRRGARTSPAGHAEKDLLGTITNNLFALPHGRREVAAQAVVALLELAGDRGAS
ncbi:MAG TPA: hypothetical protein VM425_06360 [Myxococcota bacterium]|nr:hypothetical protein [Myxococcota bacterium]